MDDRLLADFPSRTHDKLRYADTDRQGHVNNAVFATFLETGRVEILYSDERPVLAEGASFVIASLHLDFLAELRWPGRVDIGTGILNIGNSSLKLLQNLFQDGRCAASAETVIVQVDETSGKSRPLSDKARASLSEWLLPNAATDDGK